MKHRLPVLTLIGVLIFQLAQAQFRYHYRQANAPYVPLTAGTSVNGSWIWDDADYSIPMPFTWKLDSTISLSTLELFQSYTTFPMIVNQTANVTNQTGFLFCDADLVDRGALTGTATRSPIRYQTDGTAPFRIFKLEFYNAGFLAELDITNTLDDSASFQFWIYETTNIAEIRFGPSKVSNPSDYFETTGIGPGIAQFNRVDWDGFSSGSVYYVKNGPSSGTVIDTMKLPPTSAVTPLSAWPSNGTVMRFIPKSVACPVVAPAFSASSTGTTTTFVYTGSTTGVDSLIWNFGDASQQTVKTGFTTPLTHTYATAGKYNVTVTAFTLCDNIRYQQLAVPVSVGNLEPGVSRAYPNPATNTLHIDGVAAGTRAAIYSAIGQQVISTTLTQHRESLDLSALPAGSYMLQLRNESGTSSHRFVKQ